MTMQTASKQLILTLALVAVSLLFVNAGVLAQEDPDQPPKPPTDTSRSLQEKEMKEITVKGTVESLEGQVTAWMYGTHLFVNTTDGTRYALKSDQIDLSEYNDEKVTVQGLLVHEGLDSGPALIEVKKVMMQVDEPVKESSTFDKQSLMAAGSFLAVSVVGLLLLKLTGE